MVRVRSTGVKPLTASEIRAEHPDVTFLVWLTARAATELVDRVVRASGLSGDEVAVYSIVRSAGPITPTELARWIATPATTVSSYVKRMEARGHVRRIPSSEDRRSYAVELTPSGARVHADAVGELAPVSRAVADALGDRTAAVVDALESLRSALDEVRSTRP